MLCQLICVDRRYQRMNCFNIRELQGILKRRFFNDLVNSNDHRDLLSNSMIGLRFKLNNSQSIEPDIFSFYNIGTTDVNKTKTLELESVYGLKPFNHESTFNSLGSVFKPQGDIVTYYLSNSSFSDFITGSTKTYIVGKDYNLTSLVYALLQLPLNFNIHSLLAFDTIMLAAKSTLNLNFNFQITSAFTQTSHTPQNSAESLAFTSSNFSTQDTTGEGKMADTPTAGRFVRFVSPMINYDYKCGHYLGI